MYRGQGQHGQGIGNIFRGIWPFFRPLAVPKVKTFLKSASEAIKDGGTVKDILSNTLKPTISTLLSSTAKQVSNKLLADKPASAPLPAPEIGVPAGTLISSVPQTGSGMRRSGYKPRSHKPKRLVRHYTPLVQFPTRFNF